MLPICLALLQDADDEPLFEQFYHEYNKIVYTIAVSNLNNHHLAEECVQEVFMNFAKIFHTIKKSSDEKRVEALLKISAKNMSVDVFRKNKRHIINVVDADLNDFYNISEKEFDVCEHIILKQAIDSLPEEIKDIFFLKYLYNYSGAEIAQMLGITESLVRKRCMLGRQLAKKYIESENNE